MQAKITPTKNKKDLKKYLKPRTDKIEETENGLKAELEEPGKLSCIPGIEKYTVEGEEYPGIGGTPINGTKALVKIENRKDAARAFLTTLDGYTVYILNSNRFWDVQKLKEYNSEIVEIKDRETAEIFNFDKKVNFGEEHDFEVSEKELLKIYMEFLTQ